jgi:putative heme transporter
MWLAAAVTAATASMAAAGLQQQRVLRGAGFAVPVRSMLAITYASNAVSMTVPVAGSTVGTAFTYRQLRRRGVDAPLTSWTLAMSGVFSVIALVVVLGVATGTTNAGTSPLAVAAGALPLVALIAAGRIPALMTLASRVANRVMRRDTSSAFVRFGQFRLERRAGIAATGFAVANWSADILCLAASISAFGVDVPWPQLGIVYAAGLAASTLSITPVGIGIVESALALALSHAGVPWQVAVVAAIVYRATSCWLAVVVGWIALLRMRRAPA